MSRAGRRATGCRSSPRSPCGTCDECMRGRMTVCPNQTSIGYHYAGGFAEYMVVPAKVLAVDGLNRIPDDLSFAEASVAEPFACAINAQELARVGDGDDVIVVGSGPIGCLHVRLARPRGARACPSPTSTATGSTRPPRSSSPTHVVCSAETDVVDDIIKFTDGRGVDVTITAAAAGVTQEQALQMAARQGRISFFGGLPKDNPVIALRLQPRALPRADDHRRQRVEPRAQQAGAVAHRRRLRAGRRPDHPPAAADRRTRRPSRSSQGRGDQGDRRALTAPTIHPTQSGDQHRGASTCPSAP